MSRVVEIAPDRYDGWRERFEAANLDGPQRILTVSGFEFPRIAVLLIRRGGYAVAFVDGDALVAHKVGTRHVQSRTAAGGWSQQRFARRRSNQADALVSAVADHVIRLQPWAPDAVVLGGDRALCQELVGDARLRPWTGVPRREFYGIGDPRRAVLDTVLSRMRAVRVTIDDGD